MNKMTRIEGEAISSADVEAPGAPGKREMLRAVKL